MQGARKRPPTQKRTSSGGGTFFARQGARNERELNCSEVTRGYLWPGYRDAVRLWEARRQILAGCWRPLPSPGLGSAKAKFAVFNRLLPVY